MHKQSTQGEYKSKLIAFGYLNRTLNLIYQKSTVLDKEKTKGRSDRDLKTKRKSVIVQGHSYMDDMFIALADDGVKFKTIASSVRAKNARVVAAYGDIHCRSLLLVSL